MKRKTPNSARRILCAALAAACTLSVLTLTACQSKSASDVITVSTLEKIVDVSELSTYSFVYNGIAQVANEKKPDKIDYYVSYQSTVKAGINFEEIEISVDEQTKVITIDLPDIKITDIEVEVASLDFIFINSRADTTSVSKPALEACTKDIEAECAQQEALYELARENAEAALTALIDPFIKQLGEEYTLAFD